MIGLRWRSCFIRGENFPWQTPGGGFVRYGFYTTRWVPAETREAAEMAALALLRSEDDFARPEGYAEPVNAKVYFEEIDEAVGPQTQGGATWFAMDD